MTPLLVAYHKGRYEASILKGVPIHVLQQVLLMVLLTLAASKSAIAQSACKMELFGGYSHLWEHEKHAHGWSASFGFNANQWLTLVGDVSGHYPTEETEFRRLSTTTRNVDQYRFYFGPRLSMRKAKGITPYIQLLLGVAHTKIASSGFTSSDFPPTGPFPFFFVQSTNSFSRAAGAGLDIRASQRITVRLIQTDYIRDTGQIDLCRLICPQGLRFSSGVVIALGNK